MFFFVFSLCYLCDEYKVLVQYVELVEIIWQGVDFEILILAGWFWLDIVVDWYVKWLKVVILFGQQVYLMFNENELVRVYMKYLERKAYDKALMIINVNGYCWRLNYKIWMQLMGNKNLVEGELFMVV